VDSASNRVENQAVTSLKAQYCSSRGHFEVEECRGNDEELGRLVEFRVRVELLEVGDELTRDDTE